MEIILGTTNGKEVLTSEVKDIEEIKVIFTKDKNGLTKVYLPITNAYNPEEIN